MHTVEASLDDQVFSLSPKQFKTGSTGWFWQGKVALQGQRCQVSISAVIIGSKGGAAASVGAASLQAEAQQVDKKPRKPRKAPGVPLDASNGKSDELPGQGRLAGM